MWCTLLTPSPPLESLLQVESDSGKGEGEIHISYLMLLITSFFPFILLDTRNKYSSWCFRHGSQWARKEEEETWEVATCNRELQRLTITVDNNKIESILTNWCAWYFQVHFNNFKKFAFLLSYWLNLRLCFCNSKNYAEKFIWISIT